MAASPWSYPEALEWLYARQRLGIKLGLGKVERLLDEIGNPHHSFRSIHIAGTNGKGSVTRLIAGILTRAGLHVGSTTSPHLVTFTERIEINGEPIPQSAVARGLAEIKPVVERLDADQERPTFFEIVTALAFWHFNKMGVAWAVVETGMGGRLDATNVLSPALTVITNVDLDHQALLGPTLGDIAYEKAGIMKRGVPCITGATGDALVVIKGRSHEVQAPMSILGEDYYVLPSPDELIIQRPNGEARYLVAMAGQHQKVNAALAVAAVDALRKLGVTIPARAVHEGLQQTTHPGRLETFTYPRADDKSQAEEKSMAVLIDGAHNIGAAHALRRHLAAIDWSGFHLITGFCADKDWRDCVEQWAPLASHIWAVPVRNPRTLPPDAMVEHLKAGGIPVTSATNVAQALDYAIKAGANRVLIAGSLYLAGEARAILTGQSLEEIRGNQ